jgi:all-trans-retinol 13,14-reductase
MDAIGASERLREHLWFTWGNFGGIPSETSIGAYAVPTEFLHDGMWTPAGGSRPVAEAFAATITSAGGALRTRAEVTGLVIDGDRVAGVRVGDEVLQARAVISGIGARETYRKLVPEADRPAHADRIAAMPSSCSIFTLYLALDRSFLDRHGLDGVNYWVEFEPGAMRGVWEDLSSPPGWLLLSLAPRFQNEAGETVTAEVFVGIRGDRFARWEGSRVRKRGPEYDELKQRLAERTLDRVEQSWPGFRAAVRYAEGASPLTIHSYTGHLGGAAYGIAPVPGRYSERSLRVHSGVPGLLLTGQDVSAAGVIGAFYGGLTAASAVLLRSAAKMLSQGSSIAV